MFCFDDYNWFKCKKKNYKWMCSKVVLNNKENPVQSSPGSEDLLTVELIWQGRCKILHAGSFSAVKNPLLQWLSPMLTGWTARGEDACEKYYASNCTLLNYFLCGDAVECLGTSAVDLAMLNHCKSLLFKNTICKYSGKRCLVLWLFKYRTEKNGTNWTLV